MQGNEATWFGRLCKTIAQRRQRRYLQRCGVTHDDLPTFIGEWPDIHNAGTFHIGRGCQFRHFRLRQHLAVWQAGQLFIGEYSFLNDGVNICATQSIRMGHHTKIGDMTSIYDTHFHAVSPDRPVKSAPVTIGNNVWIGAHCMILAGSDIGDHSVISAGSIVAGVIPARCLAAGNPAKVIRMLDIPDDWLRS